MRGGGDSGGGLSSGLGGGGRRGRIAGHSLGTRAAGAAGVHTVRGAEAAAAAQRSELPRRLARGAGARGVWAGRRRDQEQGEGSRGAKRQEEGGLTSSEDRRQAAARRGQTAVAPAGPSARVTARSGEWAACGSQRVFLGIRFREASSQRRASGPSPRGLALLSR